MRISVKGRYALAAGIYLAEQYDSGQPITVISMSEKLGISKIYLEQVFSLLKRGGLVTSTKGAQGGYKLKQEPKEITVFAVLSAVELALFEGTEETTTESAPEIEAAMQDAVFLVLDRAVKDTLGSITLEDLLTEAEKHRAEQGYMFYL